MTLDITEEATAEYQQGISKMSEEEIRDTVEVMEFSVNSCERIALEDGGIVPITKVVPENLQGKKKAELKRTVERITGVECAINGHLPQRTEVRLKMWQLPFSMLKELEKHYEIQNIFIEGNYLAIHVKP